MWKNGLIRKIGSFENLLRHNLVKKPIATYIWTNIPKRKGNQEIIFGQLILKNHRQNTMKILFPVSHRKTEKPFPQHF